jgi:uncharacterized protein (DUF1778 family)
MISFRATDDVAQLLGSAENATGKTRTDLLLTLVREFLPVVARRYITEHEREIATARAVFLHDAARPPLPPAKPVNYTKAKRPPRRN